MSLFSPNAFLLGAMISAILIFGSNVIYWLLCKAFGVRVLQFVTFFHPKLPIHSTTIGKTKFILGWFPTGSYVSVFGMNMPVEERKQVPEEDLPFALFSKPKWMQVALETVPFVMIGMTLVVCILLQQEARGWMETLQTFQSLVGDAFSVMFSDAITHEEFLLSAKAMMAGQSTVVFALMLFVVYWLLCLPLNWVMRAIAWGTEKGYRILGVIGWLALLPTMWVLFWKIPKFVFSFFSWAEVFVHCGNVLVGVFVTGAVLHVLMLIGVKVGTKRS
jgi:hypothetical protein